VPADLRWGKVDLPLGINLLWSDAKHMIASPMKSIVAEFDYFHFFTSLVSDWRAFQDLDRPFLIYGECPMALGAKILMAS
jgi:hypothetical protein